MSGREQRIGEWVSAWLEGRGFASPAIGDLGRAALLAVAFEQAAESDRPGSSAKPTDPSPLDRLREVTFRLQDALQHAEADLAARLDVGVDPYDVRDASSNRYVLLDALTALTTALTALTYADPDARIVDRSQR